MLDVGCGTGICARQLQHAGAQVLGLDPDPRMAAQARRRGLATEEATFEAWDPAGRTFDAVVAAQAWHWVEPGAGAAKAAALLRPRGLLAVFWNVDRPPPALAEAFAAVYRRVAPESLAARRWSAPPLPGYAALCTTAAAALDRTPGFGAPQRWEFDWQRQYTRQQWLDQVATQGGHAHLTAEQAAEVLDRVGAAVDPAGGRFTMNYTALVVTATTSTPTPAP